MCARGDRNLWGTREGRVGTGLALPGPPGRSGAKTTWVSAEMMIEFKQSPVGVTFAVKVHPRAKKDAITGEVGDALKVALAAVPVDGKANQACIDFLAKLLKVPRSSVTIAAGRTSRNKVVRVSTLSAEEVRRRLTI